jgi:hypothetical protein
MSESFKEHAWKAVFGNQLAETVVSSTSFCDYGYSRDSGPNCHCAFIGRLGPRNHITKLRRTLTGSQGLSLAAYSRLHITNLRRSSTPPKRVAIRATTRAAHVPQRLPRSLSFSNERFREHEDDEITCDALTEVIESATPSVWSARKTTERGCGQANVTSQRF